jgi:uncharacterized surface protein with fasciclin (FAS1) repeats
MLAALVTAFVLLVAACGDSDSEESTTTVAETTTTTAAEMTTTTEAAETTTTTEAAEAGPTVADIVAGDDRFGTLLAAVQAAGLADALADPDATLTVFAPTDDAFGAALEALGLTAEELLASEDLADILLYHVLGEIVTSGDLLGSGEEEIVATTLQGESLVIVISDAGEVRFRDAGGMVIEPDIEASNGIIHVIDAVLLPPSSQV